MSIEYTIIISVITVVCTILGVSIGMSNFRRLQRNDDKLEGSQLTRVEVQLEHIEKGVSTIGHDMADIKSEIKEHRDRMVRVEESAKQAHKRIDEIAARRGAGVSA